MTLNSFAETFKRTRDLRIVA